ncbi:unnamed protein product [Spirodela intermedia]|uniref:Uncharacterized protein n=2 Tax=Spirodela intermedia TaxID=51605 RepID=A0A7I8I991_SPIIN|nr:unnamed protein product [Spirodela intermedia]CAA6654247.1 unnamed protein product [Spirodela intermedia]CAA7388586.1 unnamed protein product [Spirodela intermedia]
MGQIREENQQTTLRLEKKIGKLTLAHSKCEIVYFFDDENLEEEKQESKEEKSELERPPILILSQLDELRKIISFPKTLEPKLRKRAEPNKELMEIFKQVHISIPLIDAIKHIIVSVKKLKELCTLDDRSIKTPRGLLEHVIIHVKGCRFLVDFLILDISILDHLTHAPIILGHPFLDIEKANID